MKSRMRALLFLLALELEDCSSHQLPAKT